MRSTRSSAAGCGSSPRSACSSTTPSAPRHFAEADQRVEGICRVPRPRVRTRTGRAGAVERHLNARNPDRNLELGGDRWSSRLQGPAVRAGRRRAPRRDDGRPRATPADGADDRRDSTARAAAASSSRTTRTADSRHLECALEALGADRQAVPGLADLGRRGADLACDLPQGLRDCLTNAPACVRNVIANSRLPLRRAHAGGAAVDDSASGQVVVVTPFLLMGAMAPVTIPSALVQQTAEALAGSSRCAAVHPGRAPRDGPQFLPFDRHAVGLAGLRRAGVVVRAARLGAARAPLPPALALGRRLADDQPAARRAGRLRGHEHHAHAAFLSGANVCWRRAGGRRWARRFREARGRPRANRAAAAAVRSGPRSTRPASPSTRTVEVGHGGHFLGAAHTLARFRDCFYRPLVSTTENFERWTRNGAKEHRDAFERAGRDAARGIRGARDARWSMGRDRRVRRPPAARARRLAGKPSAAAGRPAVDGERSGRATSGSSMPTAVTALALDRAGRISQTVVVRP